MTWNRESSILGSSSLNLRQQPTGRVNPLPPLKAAACISAKPQTQIVSSWFSPDGSVLKCVSPQSKEEKYLQDVAETLQYRCSLPSFKTSHAAHAETQAFCHIQSRTLLRVLLTFVRGRCSSGSVCHILNITHTGRVVPAWQFLYSHILYHRALRIPPECYLCIWYICL